MLDEKIAKCDRPPHSFNEAYRTTFAFLSNPQQLRSSDRLEHKKTILELAFREPLPYCKKRGYRTPQKPLPFSLLEKSGIGKYDMVPTPRIELGTF